MLYDVAKAMSSSVERDVNFMVYRSVDAAIARAPSIMLP